VISSRFRHQAEESARAGDAGKVPRRWSPRANQEFWPGSALGNDWLVPEAVSGPRQEKWGRRVVDAAHCFARPLHSFHSFILHSGAGRKEVGSSGRPPRPFVCLSALFVEIHSPLNGLGRKCRSASVNPALPTKPTPVRVFSHPRLPRILDGGTSPPGFIAANHLDQRNVRQTAARNEKA
jgi:hypothetical protein